MFSLVAYIHSTKTRQTAAPSNSPTCTTPQVTSAPKDADTQSKTSTSSSGHSSPSSHSSPKADSAETAKQQAVASDFFYIGQCEVVKVEQIMSAIDSMSRDMALDDYLLPVAQSEVVRTLKKIRRAGKVGTLPQNGVATSK